MLGPVSGVLVPRPALSDDDLSYHQKMAKEAELRAKILYLGRPDPSPNPRVSVEPNRRREVEAFAAKLRDVQPPLEDRPEQLEYARMEASAMISKLANGKANVLEALQNAVLSEGIGNTFVDVLDANRIGSKVDRNNLRLFVSKQDTAAAAACLRLLSKSTFAVPGEEIGGQVDVGLEKCNHFDPLMGTNRRAHATVYLRGTDLNNPAPFRRPPGANVLPETLSAIELGDDQDQWEREVQYHAMILDTCNAAMNLMEEAYLTGRLDGRILGDREAERQQWQELMQQA